jgi:hypothetical protein
MDLNVPARLDRLNGAASPGFTAGAVFLVVGHACPVLPFGRAQSNVENDNEREDQSYRQIFYRL